MIEANCSKYLPFYKTIFSDSQSCILVKVFLVLKSGLWFCYIISNSNNFIPNIYIYILNISISLLILLCNKDSRLSSQSLFRCSLSAIIGTIRVNLFCIFSILFKIFFNEISIFN